MSKSRSYPPEDLHEFYQLIEGSYKRDRPIHITGFDKIHLKADCLHRNIVNGVREIILNSSALSSAPGQKIYKEPKIKLLKRTNKPILCLIKFYLEDDDHKPVNFDRETISLTCQLIKI